MIHTARDHRVVSRCMAAIGDRLRNAREEAKLTQEQLAAKMSTTQSVVSAWEAGSRTISVRRLRDFARQTGTTPEALDPERAAYHPNRPRASGRPPRSTVPPNTHPVAAGAETVTPRDKLIALMDAICDTPDDWNELRSVVLEYAASQHGSGRKKAHG
jgi:transcriptional regulator with XRE-family HTH domain